MNNSEKTHWKAFLERENVVLSPSVWSFDTLLMLFLISLVLSNIISFSVPWLVLEVEFIRIGWFQLGMYIPILCFVPAGIFLLLIHSKYNSRYVIAAEKLIVLEGLYSMKKQQTDILFADICSFNVVQTPLNRLFHVGDLEVVTSAKSKGSCNVRGVRHPELVQGMIERRIGFLNTSSPGSRGLKG